MIEYRPYNYLDFTNALNNGAISFEGIIQIFDNPNKIGVLYDTTAESPVVSADTAVADDGTPVLVSYWDSCLVIVDKTGTGTCAVDIQGRQKDGTWYTLPNTVGGTLTQSLGAGAQTFISQVDLVGWYELRVKVSSVVGDVSVTGTVSRGH